MTNPLCNQRIVVLGGAGFVGSHLVDRLIRETPQSLAVFDNFSLGQLHNLSNAQDSFPGLSITELDCSNLDALRCAIEAQRPDYVFNLAVLPLPESLSNPFRVAQQNTALALAACELLREGHFKTLVHLSSSEVYGSATYVPMDEGHIAAPTTPYAASKAAGDVLCTSYAATFNLDIRLFRPFNLYGPRQNMGRHAGIVPCLIRAALSNQPFRIHGSGEQTRDFTFVQDAVEAIVRLTGLHRTPEVVNICSEREVSVSRVVEIVNARFNNQLTITYGKDRPSDVQRHFGSTKRLRAITGFQPGTPFEEGISRTIEWYRQNLKERLSLTGDPIDP